MDVELQACQMTTDPMGGDETEVDVDVGVTVGVAAATALSQMADVDGQRLVYAGEQSADRGPARREYAALLPDGRQREQ